jgi:ABC-type multidrug transport system fused ATPase/permease subunit
MNFDFIIKRVLGLLKTPNEEWEKIKEEKTNFVDLFKKYAIVLAAIPAVFSFLGWIIIGKSYGYATFRMPFGRAIVYLVFYYILSLVGVFLLGLFIDVVSEYFDTPRDIHAALKIAVYSSTASWIAGVFNIIPVLAPIGVLAGLYSLYLLFIGIRIIKAPDKNKEITFFVVTLIVYIVAMVFVAMMTSLIVFGTTKFMF